MSVSSLIEKRWDGDDDTRSYTVADMLRVALAKIEKGEIVAEHGILVLGKKHEDRGSCETDWLQAGTFDFFSQIGMIERAKMSIAKGAEE